MNNAVIRVQQECDATATSLKKQEGEIATLASALKPFPNTVVTKEWTQKQPYLWQAHLERISDFMMHGPGVWWKHHKDGIEFLDGPDEDSSKVQGPFLHHFRSCSLKDEETFLKECWDACITNTIPLPLCSPRVYDQTGTLHEHVLQSNDIEDTSKLTKEQSAQEQEQNDESDDDNESVVDLQENNVTMTDLEKENNPTHLPEMVASTVSTSDCACASIPNKYTYQTKLCQQISNVMGNVELLQNFDKLRNELKTQKKKINPRNQKIYKESSAVICIELTTTLELFQSKFRVGRENTFIVMVSIPVPRAFQMTSHTL